MPRLILLAALALGAVLAAPLHERAFAQHIRFGPQDDAPRRATPKKPAKPLAVPPAPDDSTLPGATAPAPAKPQSPSAAVAPAAPKPAVPGPVTSTPYSTSALPPKPAPANCKNTSTFDNWMAGFRREAAAEGISNRTMSRVLDGMTLDSGIISRDRRQSFFAQSFVDFSGKLATGSRVQNGKSQIKRNADAFQRVNQQFGVPSAVITGFWALESDFGVGMGTLPILRSLGTLAYDCRRGPMFREELKAAMKIIDRGDMTPDTMVGSWAGEIGQTQFLPTRYLEHAIDYDGDGTIDLFRNSTDIIGSTANYMNHLGWRPNEPWLHEVRLTKTLPWEQADLAVKHPLTQWAQWGVTDVSGAPLETGGPPASLMLPMGRKGVAFLAYPNFDVYLKWNQSLNYAITAAYLATRIEGAKAMSRGSPDIPVLDFDSAKELQRQLVRRGFDVGEVDGKVGASTRAAVKAMQLKLGMPADSYPTPELLAALRAGS